MSLKRLWAKIPLDYRKEITSASHTFCATLVTVLMAEFTAGRVPTSRDAWIVLGATALRAAWKAAANSVIGWLKSRQ